MGKAIWDKIWKRLKGWWGLLFGTSAFRFGNIAWDKLRDMIWGRLGDADLFNSVINWFGVDTETIITFLLGPEFSLMMAAVGALGMIFLEKPEIVAKHPITKPLGAAFFVFFASVVGTSLLFEQAIQTPKFAEITKFYLDSQNSRTISDDDLTKMKEFLKSHPEVKQAANIFGPPVIYSSSDNNSEEYQQNIYERFQDLGIPLRPDGQGPQESGDVGIMIQITDPKNPSIQAKAFMSILAAGHIPYKTEIWTDRIGWPVYPDFAIFVTRDYPVPD